MKYNLYDFDGTIYDGDSGIDIIIYAIKKYPKFIFIAGWSVILYVFKLINKKQFKSKMFSFVKYIDDMDKFVEGFWCKNEKKLKEFWLAKSSHKNDIIISASGDFWLKYIAEKYKVADLFATIYDLKNGEISGNNCHGEEKVKLFYERYPDGVIFSMYTDSENDRPLIEKAIHGYFVKKDKILPAKEVKKNNFR